MSTIESKGINNTIEHINAKTIKSICGYTPKNIDIYINAFVHKSASKELERKSYETLEFLGDSVLGMIIAQYLFNKYPDENEGFLTRIRTKIVNSKSLASLARQLKMETFIVMNEKAMNNNWNENSRMLEDVFESFIGALYLDRGFDLCKKFVIKIIEKYLNFEEVEKDTNYKDILMKFLQKNKLPNPEYKVNYESGPGHSKLFTVEVVINNNKIAEGTDINKKQAEQNAAMRTLKALELLCK